MFSYDSLGGNNMKYLALVLLFSQPATASYYDSCEVLATIKEVKQIGILNQSVSLTHIDQVETSTYVHIAEIEVTKILSHDGHSDCEHLKESRRWIELKEKDQNLIAETSIQLQYQFISGRQSGGYGNRLEWTLLRPKKP